MYDFGSMLKRLRFEKNVSMDKMIEDINALYGESIAKSTISKWENNKAYPSMESTKTLCNYFNVSLDYMMGLSAERELNRISTMSLSKDELILLDTYKELNDLGKKEATKRVSELRYMPMYSNKISFKDFNNIAAHNDRLTDEEISEVDRRILEDLNKK